MENAPRPAWGDELVRAAVAELGGAGGVPCSLLIKLSKSADCGQANYFKEGRTRPRFKDMPCSLMLTSHVVY